MRRPVNCEPAHAGRNLAQTRTLAASCSIAQAFFLTLWAGVPVHREAIKYRLESRVHHHRKCDDGFAYQRLVGTGLLLYPAGLLNEFDQYIEIVPH